LGINGHPHLRKELVGFLLIGIVSNVGELQTHRRHGDHFERRYQA
jgi:hypothetical protein